MADKKVDNDPEACRKVANKFQQEIDDFESTKKLADRNRYPKISYEEHEHYDDVMRTRCKMRRKAEKERKEREAEEARRQLFERNRMSYSDKQRLAQQVHLRQHGSSNTSNSQKMSDRNQSVALSVKDLQS
jgi:hypothetical protein